MSLRINQEDLSLVSFTEDSDLQITVIVIIDVIRVGIRPLNTRPTQRNSPGTLIHKTKRLK